MQETEQAGGVGMLPLPHDPSDLGPDLSVCDREPIHVPGAIQPHGLLLVGDAATGVIKGGAGALEQRLTPDWLGRTLRYILGDDLMARMPGPGQLARTPLGRVAGPREAFAATGLRVGSNLIVEFEPTAKRDASSAELLGWLDEVGGTFERTSDLRELCERAASVFRELLGFDRVMIYRFLDDDAGVVVAEDKAEELGTFMNHHFPASDIPKQARALYIRNRVRSIPDATYTPAPLRPASAELARLDLSDVDLRSVSPIHLQYLRNMGVTASASISIVKDGLLWGLVACHHGTPRAIPTGLRLAARTLAGGLARQVRAKEDAENYRERLRLRAAEDAVGNLLGADLAWETLFAQASDQLRRMLDADGFAARQGDHFEASGMCPARPDVDEIAAWLRKHAAAGLYATDRLPEAFPAAQDYRERCSGLMAVVLPTESPTVLMWFRAEQVEIVNWAGNPHKATQVDPGAVLTPRTSFEQWTEAVRGRSRPWSLNETEAALRLRRNLTEARQNRRIRELNRELTAALAERDALLGQKDHLLKEVNHRVQNSLQLVSAFLAMQARAVNEPALTLHLKEAQRRLSAVALVHRRLYSDGTVESVDLARYIDELCADVKASMGADWASHFTLDLAPILVAADRAVHVGLILTELLINATKYAYGGTAGPISVSTEQHRNRLRLIVADRGTGKIATGREGFGTRMLRAMVDGLSGTIEETANKPGLRVIVTAPILATG